MIIVNEANKLKENRLQNISVDVELLYPAVGLLRNIISDLARS